MRTHESAPISVLHQNQPQPLSGFMEQSQNQLFPQDGEVLTREQSMLGDRVRDFKNILSEKLPSIDFPPTLKQGRARIKSAFENVGIVSRDESGRTLNPTEPSQEDKAAAHSTESAAVGPQVKRSHAKRIVAAVRPSVARARIRAKSSLEEASVATKEVAGRTATMATKLGKEAVQRTTEYFTDEEEGKKRAVVAGVIGIVTVGAIYGVYKHKQRAEQGRVAYVAPRPLASEYVEKFEDTVGEKNILDKYADEIDYKSPTVKGLMELGYGFNSAATIHELIVGDPDGVIMVKNAEQLRNYAAREKQRSINLDKLLDQNFSR